MIVKVETHQTLRFFRKLQCCAGLVITLFIRSVDASVSAQDWPEVTIQFCNKTDSTQVSGRIADTPSRRAIGYQGSPSFDAILFVWETPQIRRFWMRNTAMPLDLWHLDDSGQIVEHHALTPYSELILESQSPGRFSIETPVALNLNQRHTVGDFVTWNGRPCSTRQ